MQGDSLEGIENKTIKGQIISKGLFGVLEFSKKKERKNLS